MDVRRRGVLPAALWICTAGRAWSQAADPAAMAQLLEQMKDLRAALGQMQGQLAESRRESEQLRAEMQAMRQRLDTLRAAEAPVAAAQAEALPRLVEEQEVLAAKVEDHYQTKVESGSRYRVRFSGMALMNLVSTRGAVDNLDRPSLAKQGEPGEANGSFGAGVRQSFFGFDVFGPRVAGASTTGSVHFDFFGGFPNSGQGTSSALVRLRTASLRLDWKNTSLVTGQEQPFFSPLSPSSLAAVAYPALSGSGNLWTWTPQVFVEHRLAVSEHSKIVAQAGLLDSFSGEPPPDEYEREPLAGEYGRAPAAAGRLAWERVAGGRTLSAGGGAYWARQNWAGSRVTAWTATLDWQAPVGRWFSISGEMYRGQSMAGLGGSATPSILFRRTRGAVSTSVVPLSSAGGWSQLKFKPIERLEFNAGYGKDRPFRTGLGRLLAAGEVEGGAVSRNATGFVNAIYQVRSNFLLSAEYQNLRTGRFEQPRSTADHVALTGAILF